jgi:chorismate mutase
MIRRAIAMAVNKENLSRELAESVMDEIMSGPGERNTMSHI